MMEPYGGNKRTSVFFFGVGLNELDVKTNRNKKMKQLKTDVDVTFMPNQTNYYARRVLGGHRRNNQAFPWKRLSGL